MAYSTRFSKEEIRRIGIRLHAVRILTGMNREDFAQKQNISSISIKNWELGRVLPRQDGVLSIVNAFKECGVFTTIEWILYGSGAGPNYFETATFEQEEGQLGFLEQQIALFKKAQRSNGLNPVVITITDDSMSPLYGKGDLVGGVIISNEIVVKQIERTFSDKRPWLVSFTNGLFVSAFLYTNENRLLLNTVKNPKLQEVTSSSIAKIKWHYVAGE